MRKVLLHIVSLVIIWLSIGSQSIGQCIIDGPIIIPELGQNSASVTVSGLTNSDLSNPGQGLCGLRVKFRHSAIGDLLLTLRSPSGQLIQLTGPESSGIVTSLASWDVTFIPCADAPAPDPGFSTAWSNNQAWALIGGYSGSYYPYSGCFEDLMGSANGLWTVIATDNQQFDGGEIEEIEFFFCDDDGQNCDECGADGGILDPDTVKQCVNDIPVTLNLTPSFLGSPPDPTYAYFYAVLFNGEVVDVVSEFDNAGLAVGVYTLCGVSVLHSDTNLIKSYPANIDIVGYEDFLLSSNICFDLSNECAILKVQPELAPIFQSETICAGDTFFFRGQSFTESGSYLVRNPGANDCPRDHNLALLVLDPVPGIQVIDSFGCGHEMATLLGMDSTYGNAVDFHWFTLNGSILTNTAMPQIDVGSSGIYYLVTTRNFNGTLFCSDTASIELLNNFDEVQVSYRGDTISCAEDSVLAQAFGNVPGATFIWRNNVNNLRDTSINRMVHWGDDLTLFALSQQGCIDSILIELPYDTAAPMVSVTDIQKDCRDDSVSLAPSTMNLDWSYLWVLPSGDSVFQFELRTAELGQFTLVVSAANGCTTQDTTTISFIGPAPSFQIVTDTFFCYTDSIAISVSSNLNEFTYEISGPASFVATNRDTHLVDIGDYLITVETVDGCLYDTMWTTPTLFDIDSVDVIGGTLSCLIDSVELVANALSNDVQYNWSGPSPFMSQEPSPFVHRPGSYELLLTTKNGCQINGVIEVPIDSISPTVSIEVDSLTCLVDSVQMITNANGALYTYQWNGPQQFRSMDQRPWVRETGEYYVSVTGDNGCQVVYSQFVVENVRMPSFILDASTITCIQSTVDVTVTTDAPTIEWTAPGFVSNDAITTLPGSEVYALNLLGTNGCDTTISFIPDVDTTRANLTLDAGIIGCVDQETFIKFESDIAIASSEWTPSTVSNPSADFTTTTIPGMYRLMAVAQNGCISVDSIEVTIDTMKPLIVLSADTLKCNNTKVDILFESDRNDIFYRWTGPQGFTSLDSIPSVMQPGKYVIDVIRSNGCQAMDSIFIAADTIAPTLMVDAELFSCDDTTAMARAITTGNVVQYSWIGPGFTAMTQDVILDRLGSYTVFAFSENGCLAIDSFSLIDFDLVDDVILIQDSINCNTPLATHYIETSEPNISIEWFEGINSASTVDSLTTDFGGTLSVRLANAKGCQWDSVFIPIVDTMSPIPIIEQTGEIQCEERVVKLTATNLTNPTMLSYAWSTSNGNILSSSDLSEIQLNQAGDYALLVANPSNGCQSEISTMVDELPNNLNIGNLIVQQPNCMNGYEALVEIADVTGQNGIVRYLVNRENDQFSPNFGPLDAGLFAFFVVDERGCLDSASVTIDDVTVRFVNIERDTVMLLGQRIFIEPVTNVSSGQVEDIDWTVNGMSICDDCDSLFIQPSVNGNYAIHILDTSGCLVSDSIYIQIISLAAMYIPTAFSPNDDGINDMIGPYFGNNVQRVNEFSIYSRWGDRIHHRTNMSPEDSQLFWDGQLKNEYLNPGVFVYTISIELIDGMTVNRKGEFQLVR